MKRMPAVVLIALAISGCQGGGEPPPAPNASGSGVAAAVAPAPTVQPGPLPPGPTAPRAQLRAGFGGLVDTIEVSAIEPLPLREAALIAPDGTTVPANYINVTDNPSLATGTWSLSNRWGEAAGSNNALAVLALPNMQAGAALRANEQLLAMVSRADIPLPDPVAYRRDWRNWRIRLGFGTPPGELQTLEIPAPEPPPG